MEYEAVTMTCQEIYGLKDRQLYSFHPDERYWEAYNLNIVLCSVLRNYPDEGSIVLYKKKQPENQIIDGVEYKLVPVWV